MSKKYKFIYMYVRYTCIFYFGLLFFGSCIFVLEVFKPSNLIMNFYFICCMACIPAFMILPGLIYDDYKGAFHGFTISQLRYSLFFGLTLGLGPVILFFKEYDSKLKKHFLDS